MGIGASVFLLALGAILTFAIDKDSVDIVNINMIGVILMLAGAVGLALTMLVFGRRDRVGAGVVEDRVVTRDVV